MLRKWLLVCFLSSGKLHGEASGSAVRDGVIALKEDSHSFFCVEGGNKELWSSGHHLKSCREVAFSHDREKLFSISKDKSVHIMDVEGGKLVKRIPKAHSHSFFCVEGGNKELWSSGHHLKSCREVAFSHDREKLFSISKDKSVHIMDVEGGKLVKRIPKAHSHSFFCVEGGNKELWSSGHHLKSCREVAFSHDREKLFSISKDKSVHIMDVEGGKLVKRIPKAHSHSFFCVEGGNKELWSSGHHLKSCREVAFSHDREKLFSISKDKSVHIMDVEGGKLVKRIPKAHSHSFFCVEGGNKELWSSGHHLKSCREVAFSHDREKLFSISKDKSVHIMDVEGGKLVKRIPKAHSHSFFCVEGGNKELWSSGHHLKSCREVAFSHDREKLFSISKDKSVHIMDVEGGKLVKRIPKAHSHSFFCVEGGNKELWSSGHHLKSCREVAFSHDREKLFSISKDKSVHIMDVEGGKLVKRIPKAHSHSFFCVEGGNKELWSSGHHLKSCREVAFSHDREKLFSISKDKSVHIMDVEGGKLVKRIPKAHRVTAFVELKQHEEYISGMAFDHDKKIILTTRYTGEYETQLCKLARYTK
ncbi:uncharacterized protein LOC121309241, partial [Polyodon spathula]|uniref:uncharacterized protein LOC121309241 n=1 Tax=Polyodon spathula TaxID=7913 RepID=UPI001B7DA30F